MSKAAMNLQDSFLNQVRRENSEVRVLLVNGTLLRGTVKGFDNFTLILNNRNGQHLIYKHAVAQIVTQRPHVRAEDMHEGETSGTGEVEGEASESRVEASTTGDKPAGERPVQNQKAAGSDKPQRHDRGHGDRGQGERNQGERNQGDRNQGQGERNQGDRNKGERSKSKKEGFNTLDLSGVKIGEDKKD